MLPQLERAILAGHDMVLLGERGQGKTRLIRTLAGLLDEWTPVVAGCEINDHPYAPVCARCLRLAAELGDELPVSWRHRDERYGEKLATPDTSVGDLIGDIDPVKVAEGRTLGDPETIHYGLVPRTNRGIFCLNELPDLAERIQVALLNVLEERDIQVRGYALRLPLDLLLVASANPEDYTNRGRIITPLKDRFGAEIRTHYPLVAGRRAGADPAGGAARLGRRGRRARCCPTHLVEVIARFTRLVRASPAVDARSGVSARFAIAAAETVAASAVRRAAITGEDAAGGPGLRPACDREHAARQGRVRGQRGGPGAGGARAPAAPGDRRDLPRHAGQRRPVRPAGEVRRGRQRRDRRPGARGASCCAGSARSRAWPRSWTGSAWTAASRSAQAAAALEFALEGLHLMRRLSKDAVDGGAVYRT